MSERILHLTAFSSHNRILKEGVSTKFPIILESLNSGNIWTAMFSDFRPSLFIFSVVKKSNIKTLVTPSYHMQICVTFLSARPIHVDSAILRKRMKMWNRHFGFILAIPRELVSWPVVSYQTGDWGSPGKDPTFYSFYFYYWFRMQEFDIWHILLYFRLFGTKKFLNTMYNNVKC